MPLIQLIVILIVIGVLMWAVNSIIPMDAKIKQILNVVVIAFVVIWLVTLIFGIDLSFGGAYVGPRH